MKKMKIAYLCQRRRPHSAHKRFINRIGSHVKVDVIRVRPFTPTVLRSLVGGRYDIALADGLGTLPVGWLAKKTRLVDKLIFVTTSHSFAFHQKACRVMLRDVDGIVATSSLMRLLIERLFEYKGLVTTCFPIPSLTDFLEVKPSIDAKRACFIGGDSLHKGADLLPKIIHKVHKEIKSGEIYVVGHLRHHKPRIEKKTGIAYLGYVPKKEMLITMSKCSIYIHPARIEAFGASVVEAMAAGLIPIVTKMTGSKDLVELLDPSLVVPLDVDAINERIVEIWSMNSEKRKEFSKKAKQIALEHQKKSTTAFASVLETFLKRNV